MVKTIILSGIVAFSLVSVHVTSSISAVAHDDIRGDLVKYGLLKTAE